MIVNGNGGTPRVKQTGPNIDWTSLFGSVGQLLGNLIGGGQKDKALEEQRIKLEASLRKKLEDEFKTTQMLLAGLALLLIFALLLRR